MDKADQEKIRRNYAFLLIELAVECLLGIFIEKNVFSIDQKEEILHKDTRRRKIDTFLDILYKSGSKAYDVFLYALEKTNSKYIADRLRNTDVNDTDNNLQIEEYDVALSELKVNTGLVKDEPISSNSRLQCTDNLQDREHTMALDVPQVKVFMEEIQKKEHATVHVMVGQTNTIQNIVQGDCTDKMKLMLDKTTAELIDWKNTRECFEPTAAFRRCEENLKKNGHLNIVGASGDGKTSIAMELLYNFYQSGLSVIILREPYQWEDLDIKHNEPLLVLIDDMFGGLRLINNKKEKWLSKARNMYCVVKEKRVQIVTTCRENIYMSCEKELNEYKLFKTENNIYLSRSDSDCLTSVEKEIILKKHILSNPKIVVDDSKVDLSKVKTEWKISKNDVAEITRVKTTAVGFPLCCKAFVSNFECFKKSKDFFNRPFEVIDKILDIMRESDDEERKYEYCVLGCVLIYGQLTDSCIENIDNEGSDVQKNVEHLGKACKLQKSSITSQNIRDAGNRLTTSYLTYSNNQFSFQHNSMLEAVFSSYLKTQAPLLLKLCEWGLIKSLVSTEDSTTENTAGVLHPRHYNAFATRLTFELTACSRNSKLRMENLLSHSVLTSQTFVDYFFTNLTIDQTISLMNKDYYDCVYGLDYDSRSILFYTCVFGSSTFLDKVVSELRRQWSTQTIELVLKSGVAGACRYGNYDVYQYITRYTDTKLDWHCLYNAAEGGNLPIFTDLLKRDLWEDSDIYEALKRACSQSKFDVYKLLMADIESGRHSVVENGNLLESAVDGAQENLDIGKDIISDLLKRYHFDNSDIHDVLCKACRRFQFDVYKLLMANIDSGRYSAILDDDLLVSASDGFRGNPEIGKDIISDLLKRNLWDDRDIHTALSRACYWGHFEVYKLLMADIDSGRYSVVIDDELLKTVIDDGLREETAKYIMYDLLKRDLWNDSNIYDALCGVCYFGQFDVYKLLMTDIDSGRYSVVIDVEVLDHVAEGVRYNPETGKNIVSDLFGRNLWDDRDIHTALSKACYWGNVNVYKLLMAEIDSGRYSVVIDDELLKKVIDDCLRVETGQYIMHDLLERDLWNDSSIYYALCKVCGCGQFDVYRLLMDDIDSGRYSVVIDDEVLVQAAEGARYNPEPGKNIIFDLSCRGFIIPELN